MLNKYIFPSVQATKVETTFTVFTPPHIGFYKLEIFASRVPKSNGKINLPLVATFMVEVNLQITERGLWSSILYLSSPGPIESFSWGFSKPRVLPGLHQIYPTAQPNPGVREKGLKRVFKVIDNLSFRLNRSLFSVASDVTLSRRRSRGSCSRAAGRRERRTWSWGGGTPASPLYLKVSPVRRGGIDLFE